MVLQRRIRVSRRSVVQLWLIGALFAASPGLGWTQTPVPLEFTDGCASCSLIATAEHRFSTEAGDLAVVNSMFASVRDSRGRIWLSFSSAPLVNVLDSLGSFQGVVGTRGEGPGEFAMPTALVAMADSVLVFDPGLARMTVVGPDLVPSRSVRFLGQAFGGVALGWPRILLNATIPTGPSVGRPYHILNIATGAVEKSFGGRSGGNFHPRDLPLLFGHVATARDGPGVWTLQRARFVLQRWTPQGQLEQSLTVSPEWFPDGGRAYLGTKDVPPDPLCVGLHPLEDGRLLVFVLLARPDWSDAWGRGSEPVRGHIGPESIPAPQSIRESYVLLVDPAKGEIAKLWPADVFPVGASHGRAAMIEVEDLEELIPTVLHRSFSVKDSQRTPQLDNH